MFQLFKSFVVIDTFLLQSDPLVLLDFTLTSFCLSSVSRGTTPSSWSELGKSSVPVPVQLVQSNRTFIPKLSGTTHTCGTGAQDFPCKCAQPRLYCDAHESMPALKLVGVLSVLSFSSSVRVQRCIQREMLLAT